MKNKFILIIFLILLSSNLKAENVQIEAKNITIDKDQETTIFENDVTVTTKNKTIKSDLVKFNKLKGHLILEKNIKATDFKKNFIKAQYAEYFTKEKLFKSIGQTEIITSENYTINGADISIDNNKKIISSKKKSIIRDPEGNQIFLDNFEYLVESNIFKSIGYIKIEDKINNTYEFSQIYIDTKKKEILGTDIKTFYNNEDFKYSKSNKPRLFANTVKIDSQNREFKKGIFTICDYRENDKCPPWTVQASKILHDKTKKTLYYDNALIKIYDVPIFYFPKLSHPDPTVKRRSGFLVPSLLDTKNLGSGVSIPYFFNINRDKNFTLDTRLYAKENPFFSGEYHQAFKNSSLLADFGYTQGYKKISNTKKAGDKSHFFSKYVKNFKGKNNSENNLNISFQSVSNNKYLKLYKIKSNLVDYNKDYLESSIDYSYENNDFFLGLNANVFETLKENYNDKYEYILPEITLGKNLFSNERLGVLDFESNFKVHNYDTNKNSTFLTNDFDWSKNVDFLTNSLSNKVLAKVKNFNYEAKNIEPFKQDLTSELYGAVGLFSELSLFKENINSKHFLNPKILLRYAPGNMRNEDSGSRLTPLKAFTLDRISKSDNFETGLSGTFGFDYENIKNDKKFDFSVAQIISEKENKKMPTKTGLDEKLSDLVGSANYDISNNIKLNYNFALDQNYSDFNFNEIGATMNFDKVKFNFNYLEEKKHIGDQEYFKTKLEINGDQNKKFSLETKRNLLTNSAEFYNLSYEYLNDCLRAGLVYRREFYNDSELEPENSLLFKITLIPFGSINSPTFSN